MQSQGRPIRKAYISVKRSLQKSYRITRDLVVLLFNLILLVLIAPFILIPAAIYIALALSGIAIVGMGAYQILSALAQPVAILFIFLSLICVAVADLVLVWVFSGCGLAKREAVYKYRLFSNWELVVLRALASAALLFLPPFLIGLVMSPNKFLSSLWGAVIILSPAARLIYDALAYFPGGMYWESKQAYREYLAKHPSEARALEESHATESAVKKEGSHSGSSEEEEVANWDGYNRDVDYYEKKAASDWDEDDSDWEVDETDDADDWEEEDSISESDETDDADDWDEDNSILESDETDDADDWDEDNSISESDETDETDDWDEDNSISESDETDETDDWDEDDSDSDFSYGLKTYEPHIEENMYDLADTRQAGTQKSNRIFDIPGFGDAEAKHSADKSPSSNTSEAETSSNSNHAEDKEELGEAVADKSASDSGKASLEPSAGEDTYSPTDAEQRTKESRKPIFDIPGFDEKE